ncbi:CPBP family intramembrane glutamic endopeptidase [Saccharicrinis carchari]
MGKILIAPIMEELIFRGVIFKLLKENYSFWISVIISSMLFAGVHFNFSDLSFLFVYGILFCWVYDKTKSLWAPIVLHVLINFYSQTTRIQEFSMSPLNSLFYVIMVLLSVILVLHILRFMGKNKHSSSL